MPGQIDWFEIRINDQCIFVVKSSIRLQHFSKFVANYIEANYRHAISFMSFLVWLPVCVNFHDEFIFIAHTRKMKINNSQLKPVHN